jgi:HK97 family phage major capsid protein
MKVDTILRSKALREQRAPLGKTIREMADKIDKEKRDFSAEELSNWEKVNKDYDAFTRQIEIAERSEKITSDVDVHIGDPRVGRDDTNPRPPKGERPNPAERAARQVEDEALCLQAWMRRKMDLPLKRQHKEAIKRVKSDPRRRSFTANMRDHHDRVRERRALSIVSGTAGAYTVPQGFIPNLEEALLAYGGMWSVADVMVTDSGNDLMWPTVNDTSNEGVEIAENTTVGNQDVAFSGELFKAWKYTSKMILVPVELLEDSAFAIATYLGRVIGERLARIGNRRFTVGDGVNKPSGIVNDATLGVTAASATAIAADELFNLLHSVDPLYRALARFMFHDNVLLVIRKLKDSQNRYLWQESMRVGEPDQLLGKPIVINQHMASSVATTNKTVLFGQFDKYKVRQVRGVRLRHLVERYADADQEGFCGFMRMDGHLLDAGTHPVKYLQQA